MKFEGQITANLPAINLACTASFYQSLGFDLVYQLRRVDDSAFGRNDTGIFSPSAFRPK